MLGFNGKQSRLGPHLHATPIQVIDGDILQKLEYAGPTLPCSISAPLCYLGRTQALEANILVLNSDSVTSLLCVLGKSLNLSEPEFFHGKKKDPKVFLSQKVVRRIK